MKTSSFLRALRIFFYVSLFFVNKADAQQQWQWAKFNDKLGDALMSVDAKGNFYYAYQDTGISIPGHERPGYSSVNLCIVSYDCQQRFRWAKMLENYYPRAMKMDTLGGLYLVGGLTASSGAHLDEDYYISSTPKSELYIKLDTSGAYQWHILPEPDTLYRPGHDMLTLFLDVAKDGHLKTYIRTQAALNFFDGKYAVTNPNLTGHFIHLDKDGHFIDGAEEDTNLHLASYGFQKWVWNTKEDNYFTVLTAGPDAYFSGTALEEGAVYLAQFDNKGKGIWSLPLFDSSLSSYGLGVQLNFNEGDTAVVLVLSSPVAHTIAGFEVKNDSNKSHSLVVMKFSTKGELLWARQSESPITYLRYASALGQNTIGIAGSLTWGENSFDWDGHHIGRSYIPASFIGVDSINRVNYFIQLANSDGHIVSYDSILASRFEPTHMIGRNADFYISAKLQSVKRQLIIPYVDSTNYTSAFIAKYGTADCKPLSIKSLFTEAEGFKLYPNPAMNTITLEMQSTDATVFIYNCLGQSIFQNDITAHVETIDVSAYPSGLYLVIVKTDAQSQHTKLLKL